MSVFAAGVCAWILAMSAAWWLGFTGWPVVALAAVGAFVGGWFLLTDKTRGDR